MLKLKSQKQLSALIFAVLFLAVLVYFLMPEEEKPTRVALPSLPDTVELKVAYVVNARFPGLSRHQMEAILNKTSEVIQQSFGLKVTFTKPVHLSIDQFFKYLPEMAIKEYAANIVDPMEMVTHDKKMLTKGIYDTLTDYQYNSQDIIDFAKPYLTSQLTTNNLEGLSSALADTLLTRLTYWYELRAGDGKPVIDNQPYNEWVWWDSIGVGDMPYDVVITNQLVASAELYDMDVHSSIRGGITGGTTSYSKKAQYGTYSFMTVYHMLNDYDLLSTLRDDTTYTDEQIITYAATLLTHELGHMLLHLGHPFGNAACVMSPAPLLKYREWQQGLDASKCPINSDIEMTPGRAHFSIPEMVHR